jgi:hypothetical protein
VELVPAGDLLVHLEQQMRGSRRMFDGISEPAAERSYAPGKWTIKEVIGHLADAERIFACRALRIARGDATPLPGFDQEAYVPAGVFGSRTLRSLVDELGTVRTGTLALLRDLPPAAWSRRGVVSGGPMSVCALVCIIAGHELHHLTILQQRYLGGEREGSR